MLPETRIMLSSANFDDHFPYAEVYVCSGFFLVLFLEQSVLSVYGEHSHSHGDPGKGNEGEGREGKEGNGRGTPSFACQ